jgi:predicted amidohydrolase YtcJ
VLRRDPAGPAADEALWPEESVTVAQMLESWTVNAAWALGCERETGSLETGKAADLIVLSDDLLAIPAEEITEARVELTLFAGQPVHAAGHFAGLAG